MKNKNTIYIFIAVVVFAVAGYFIYTSMSSSEPATDVAAIIPAKAGGVAGKILPLGNKFDTSALKKLGTDFNVFNFPQVTLDSVGVTPGEMIKESK